MTILVKKVFISSKPTFVCLLCPPLCGPFSIQESAAGGLSYKVKNTIRFPDGVFVITYHLCYFCSIGIFYGTKKLFTPATSPSASLPNVASSWAEAPSPSSISILGIVE